MTFFQFLRAKRFVRSLGPAEIRQLREQVRQLNCSNCGAPLDIEVRMEARSILYSTLILFASMFVAVAALFGLVIWRVVRAGQKKDA